MLNVFKGKIAILLVVSMVFSNAGMMTFASSVDDVVSAASIANGNNTHNYYEGNILKDKIEGDDVGASDFVVASYASPDDEELDDVGAKLASHDDEEPEEDATIESSDKVEEGDLTSAGIEDGTIDSINNDADEKDKVNINLSTVSEVANNSLIATDSKFVKTVLEEELSTTSETLKVNESTKSDIIALEDVLSTKSSASLFGDTDKYILPANWTKGSGITKKRIDKIEILYYGKDAPSWYNISWNIEGSNGLRAYKQFSYIYIYGHQKIKISI